MKHFCIRFSIALLTFFVGLAFTSVIMSSTQIPEVKVISDDFDSDLTEIYQLSDNKVEVEYNYTLISKEFSNGVFVVTNKSKESIYYSGYDKNSHVDNWVNQNGKVTMATKLPCYNGVEEQELKPNDSAIFEIPIPRNRKPFDAGFVFMKTKNGDTQTVWVKVSEQSIFQKITN